MTLHQLRIFFTVAQASTLTRASKQLGLAQPSLSKQLAGLEESIGTRLFDRGHNRMELTDAGRLLLHHAQNVLKEIDEAEAGMREFTVGKRAVIRIAGLNSVIKALIPDALKSCGAPLSALEVDIHEAAPGEVIEMLYARQAHIGNVRAHLLRALGHQRQRIPHEMGSAPLPTGGRRARRLATAKRDPCASAQVTDTTTTPKPAPCKTHDHRPT